MKRIKNNKNKATMDGLMIILSLITVITAITIAFGIMSGAYLVIIIAGVIIAYNFLVDKEKKAGNYK